MKPARSPTTPAAQRDDDILTGEAAVTEKIQCAAVGCKGLMLFPMGKNEVLRLKTGVLQGLLSLLAVKGKHGVIGDERRPGVRGAVGRPVSLIGTAAPSR